MRINLILTCTAAVMAAAAAYAQDTRPQIHGTVRAKYEYQPEDGAGRFQVRNARVGISGDINDYVAYTAEIDLSDQGNIKMLDAYTSIRFFPRFSFTIGQMRVPFTIDAHRSPHKQFFANRSFIAKQVGNVRDVGAKARYDFGAIPVTIEAGLFNGSGLTHTNDFWTKHINFSAKAQLNAPCGYNLTLSVQKSRPAETGIMMYDIGTYYEVKSWHFEAEWLYKTYADNAFDDVPILS